MAEPNNNSKSIGERLRELREKENLNQESMGEILGVDRRTISHFERGDRNFSISILLSYSLYFNVSADYLLGIERENPSKSLRDMGETLQEMADILLKM